MANRFSSLYIEYDDSGDEYTYQPDLSEPINKINLLYTYFFHLGSFSKPKWKIDKCFIASVLRAYKNNENKAGKDLEKSIKEGDTSMLTYYNNYDEIENDRKLKNQEWQEHLLKHTYLLFEDKVYTIALVETSFLYIHQVLVHEFKSIYYEDVCLRNGSITEIKSDDEVRIHLSKELENLKRAYKSKVNDYRHMKANSLQNIDRLHDMGKEFKRNHCDDCTRSPKAMKLLLIFPSEIVRLITEYGIENTDCIHKDNLLSVTATINLHKQHIARLESELAKSLYRLNNAETIYNDNRHYDISSDEDDW